MKESKEKYLDRLWQAYSEGTSELIDAERESNRSLDKAILALSSGAFVLSFTFVEKIRSLGSIECEILLVIAWALLGLCILSTLLSFQMSIYSIRKYRELLNREHSEFIKGKTELKEKDKKNIFSTLTSVLNYFSLCFFIFGSATLIVLFAINVL